MAASKQIDILNWYFCLNMQEAIQEIIPKRSKDSQKYFKNQGTMIALNSWHLKDM